MERLPYGEQPAGEVDVIPAEPEEFAAPQAERQRADPEGFQPVVSDHVEQSFGLLDREDPLLFPAHGRRLDELGDVPVHRLLPLGIGQRVPDQSVNPLDGGGRKI
ncbi:hypothetical protein [Streptosporangium sandarakinum]